MKKKKMLIKVIVALAGISLTVSVLFFTPSWGTAILISFLCILCCYELCIPTGAIREKPVAVCGTLLAASLPWIWYFRLQDVLLPLAAVLFLTGCFLYYAAKGKGGQSKALAWLLLSSTVFPTFFSLLLPILASEHGKQIVLVPFIAAWSADTGAQLFGRCFGKRKLAPQISPNKTVAGFFGGLLFGMVGMAVYAAVICLLQRPVQRISLLAFGLVGALFGTAGDLFFSYVKREHGIKDFSSFMPEHGGVMDRFDSVVFVIPLFYAYLQAFPVA